MEKMQLNEADGGQRKYIMVQVEEDIASDGYLDSNNKTIADIDVDSYLNQMEKAPGKYFDKWISDYKDVVRYEHQRTFTFTPDDEIIDLYDFYRKISLKMVSNVNDNLDELNSSVFTFIEKEFGRTLSPMENEIIKSWLENGSSEELVREAVKEATFNGVNNLRYIDKILYEWEKKGIKNKEDVDKNRNLHRKKEKEEPVEEIFDYNWFEDDDSYEE